MSPPSQDQVFVAPRQLLSMQHVKRTEWWSFTWSIVFDCHFADKGKEPATKFEVIIQGKAEKIKAI